MFTSIVKDVFPQMIDHAHVSGGKEEEEVEIILNKLIKEKGLIAYPSWISKAIQLYQLSTVFHGLFTL